LIGFPRVESELRSVTDDRLHADGEHVDGLAMWRELELRGDATRVPPHGTLRALYLFRDLPVGESLSTESHHIVDQLLVH
jgi:hypothetical protein